MADKTPVHGQQPEAFLLSLHEQQLVEWVLVVERGLKLSRGMEHGHRQKRHVLIFKSNDHVLWVEAALAGTRRIAGVVFEPQIDTALT